MESYLPRLAYTQQRQNLMNAQIMSSDRIEDEQQLRICKPGDVAGHGCGSWTWWKQDKERTQPPWRFSTCYATRRLCTMHEVQLCSSRVSTKEERIDSCHNMHIWAQNTDKQCGNTYQLELLLVQAPSLRAAPSLLTI
jgi:hypothetical protein